mgnify:CR=1 FL=1
MPWNDNSGGGGPWGSGGGSNNNNNNPWGNGPNRPGGGGRGPGGGGNEPDLEELVRRFPNSKYARDAKLKITLTRDHIAGQEMAVGRFYQDQQRHLAAINRFKVVVDKYERTAQTPEALYRLTESYLALGLNEQAQKAAAAKGYADLSQALV